MPAYSSEPFDPYPRLREVLAPEYADLPPENIESLVERTFGPGLTAGDYEGIFDNIWGAAKSVGNAIGNVAQQASPYVAPALKGAASGAMAGAALGPWGMLGGALLGGTGGALASSGKGPARDVGGVISTGLGVAGSLGGGGGLGALGSFGAALASPRVSAGGPPSGAVVPPVATGSPAAGQLLNLLGQPQVQQALMSMMMGALGRQNVQVGSTPVPVGAFSNLLGMLANRASAESNAMQSTESEAVPEYLTSENGELRCDIANPEARADVLWELLQENYRSDLESDAGEFENTDESMENDEFYDALELAEMDIELVEVED